MGDRAAFQVLLSVAGREGAVCDLTESETRYDQDRALAKASLYVPSPHLG